jgi:hypothetical protein
MEGLTLIPRLLAAACSHARPMVALADLAVQNAMLLPRSVDTLEVLHLLHEDEPHVRRSCNYTAGDRLHYPDALQKFRTRASSGNSVIYNSSFLGLCDGNFYLSLA